LIIGELEKRLVIDPPKTYFKLWQEVQDLLKMAKDDFNENFLGRAVECVETYEEDWEIYYKPEVIREWIEKWFGSLSSIETTKVEEEANCH